MHYATIILEHCIFHVTDIFNTYMFMHQKITDWFERLPCDTDTKSMTVTVYGLCASSSWTIYCSTPLDSGAYIYFRLIGTEVLVRPTSVQGGVETLSPLAGMPCSWCCGDGSCSLLSGSALVEQKQDRKLRNLELIFEGWTGTTRKMEITSHSLVTAEREVSKPRKTDHLKIEKKINKIWLFIYG